MMGDGKRIVSAVKVCAATLRMPAVAPVAGPGVQVPAGARGHEGGARGYGATMPRARCYKWQTGPRMATLNYGPRKQPTGPCLSSLSCSDMPTTCSFLTAAAARASRMNRLRATPQAA